VARSASEQNKQSARRGLGNSARRDALAGLDKNCCEMMAVLMLMLVLHPVPLSSSV
jgi:hypothetical protein